jgi:hypothetical protein
MRDLKPITRDDTEHGVEYVKLADVIAEREADRALMREALEALETCDCAHISDGGRQWYDDEAVDAAIEKLKARIA